MDDNIKYNISNYSVKKSKNDNEFEYFDVYWLEIKKDWKIYPSGQIIKVIEWRPIEW